MVLEDKKRRLLHAQAKAVQSERYYKLKPAVRDILYGKGAHKSKKKGERYDAEHETELMVAKEKSQSRQKKHESPWGVTWGGGANRGEAARSADHPLDGCHEGL